MIKTYLVFLEIHTRANTILLLSNFFPTLSHYSTASPSSRVPQRTSSFLTYQTVLTRTNSGLSPKRSRPWQGINTYHIKKWMVKSVEQALRNKGLNRPTLMISIQVVFYRISHVILSFHLKHIFLDKLVKVRTCLLYMATVKGLLFVIFSNTPKHIRITIIFYFRGNNIY